MQSPAANMYGSTEVSGDVLAYVIDESAAFDADAKVPIGYPICGAQLSVMKPDLSGAVRRGDRGLLFVSGSLVALGYVSNDLKSSNFVCSDDGERMYNTGDLVSESETGCFSFHGRLDILCSWN